MGVWPLRVSYTPLSCWRRLWRLDYHVCVWPLRVFYTLLSFWRRLRGRLWRLDHYVLAYNWPLRVLYTLLSLSRRLWHLDHYVHVWPSRIFRPFCVFDIVLRVRPLWVRYSVCRVYTITSMCLTFWSLYTLLSLYSLLFPLGLFGRPYLWSGCLWPLWTGVFQNFECLKLLDESFISDTTFFYLFCFCFCFVCLLFFHSLCMYVCLHVYFAFVCILCWML